MLSRPLHRYYEPRIPVAVSVHPGNTADGASFLAGLERLRHQFGLEEVVVVGDRGMVSKTTVEQMRATPGLAWLTALKSVSIQALLAQDELQLDLFDQRNLFELTHPDYPGERLIACRNPALAAHRANKRDALLQATEALLAKVRARVVAGRLKRADAIGVAVGRVVNKYKVAKHFDLDIDAEHFAFSRNACHITREAALDGVYMLRTNVGEQAMDAPECVRSYKALANVERAFRSLKTINVHIRPIHHRLADRVRAHILLCVLAEYVAWHLREAWRELLFADEDGQAKRRRDPVAPAQRSPAGEAKAQTKTTETGQPAHSFQSLLQELATIVRNTTRTPGAGEHAPHFTITTTPNALQQRALDLAAKIAV